jgi:hypothetical protein
MYGKRMGKKKKPMKKGMKMKKRKIGRKKKWNG